MTLSRGAYSESIYVAKQRKVGRGTQRPVKSPAWRDALQAALKSYLHRNGVAIGQSEIGRRIGEIVNPGEDKPVPRQQVWLWFQGVRPEMRYFLALVQVLEVPPEEVKALERALMAPVRDGDWAAEPDREEMGGEGKAVRRRRGA